MKTAISIPDPLFEQADRMARQLASLLLAGRYVPLYGLAAVANLISTPRNPRSVGLAVIFGLMAVIHTAIIITLRRRERETARRMAQVPETYAELQAAMARLHETQDEKHHRRTRTPE